MLLGLERQHPQARIEIGIAYSASLDQGLQRGEFELAVLTSPTQGQAIRIEPLIDLQLRWLAGRRTSLPVGIATPAKLRDVPILTNPAASHLHATILGWFATAGLIPQRLNTYTSLGVMAKLAAAGFGVSLLPARVFAREIAAGELRALRSTPGFAPHRLSVAYRLDGEFDLSPIAASIRRATRRHLAAAR
jgi:DNA-binding transcriptional LysR family regulator